MGKRGRKYREALEKIGVGTQHGPRRAFELLKETAYTSYDATIDVAFRLGVDPRKADQMVRGSVSLPHGTGKTARVAVVASGEKIADAEAAGADHVGGDDLIERLGNGELVDELDAIIATPDQMGKLGRLGKTLGPRGLMPNPKSGTVTMDVGKAVREIKAGRVEYRTDRNGNVHAVLGRSSFSVDQLLDNYEAMLEEIVRQRPSAAKGRYLRTVAISTSQGPSIGVDATKSRELIADDEA